MRSLPPLTALRAFEAAARHGNFVKAAAELIDSNTIAIMGSACNYGYGTVDPISELSDVALERGVGLHVDGCLGGFILPWGQELGYDIPLFDFRVPGVTSISADTHKYGYGFKGTTADYAREANRQTLVCLMLEEVEAIENLPEMVTVPGVDVYFIGSGDLSQSMGYTGQPTHPDVQNMMERGVKTITGAGRIAGCSCPDNLVPKFLGLGVQYFHGSVGRLLQHGSEAYLTKMREAARGGK